MRIAVIKHGKVSNLAEFDTLADAIAFFVAPDETVLDATGVYCDIGWSYADGQFTAPVLEMTLADAIAQTQTALQAFVETLLAAAVAGYSNIERDTFPRKEREADRYRLTGNHEDAPFLAIEAASAGILLADLAQIINTKAAMLNAYTSYILGIRAYYYQAIGSVLTIEAALEFDFSSGWAPAA